MNEKSTSTSAHVLLVEDDQFTATLTAKRITDRGYQVTTVPNGEAALETIHAEEFEVVLLDMMLPGMTGIDVLKQIRQTHSQTDLPIIILTALEETDSIVQGLHAGANDYITKPANVDVMMARVATQAKLRRLYIESLRSRESEALSAMIITYHHELNNPLAIALGYLRLMRDRDPESKDIQRIEKALNRMVDVVSKISVASLGPIEKVPYSGGAGQLIKLGSE